MPTGPSASTTSGIRSPSRPKMSSARGDQATLSRSRSWVRPAVAASVTNAPVSRWTSQASLVVTTPSRVRFAAYPGHLGRGEVGVEGQAGQPPQFIGVRGEFGAQRLGPPVLPDDGVGERFAARRDPRRARSRPGWRARPRGPRAPPASARARRPASTTESAARPGRPRPVRRAAVAGLAPPPNPVPITPRSGQMTSAFVPDVPWSTASTGPVITSSPTPSLGRKP